MFCGNCGKELPDVAKFCPDCGTPVVSPQPKAIDPFAEEYNNVPKMDYEPQFDQEPDHFVPSGFASSGTQSAYDMKGEPSFIPASEFRKMAREKMKGHYGIGIGSWLLADVIGGCVPLILTGPMQYGLINVYMNLRDEREAHIAELFEGFDSFGKTLWLYIRMAIFIFLWTLLFYIPGIVKSFAYSMSMYILRDHPEMTAGEAMERSIALMRGYKGKLFCLLFSYIGWYLLSCCTFGILMFWIAPQVQMAMCEFYHHYIRPRV